jgi:hypothetical protein
MSRFPFTCFLFTLTEFMGMPWHSPASKWTRILRTPYCAAFFNDLTHLRFVPHHYFFDKTFPAAHHLAMGSVRITEE